jgi:hypothetical protein
MAFSKYRPRTEDVARVENNHAYHKPHSADQGERYDHIRRLTGVAAKEFMFACPPSRELSVALTKLEEAMFWANAAIARNEKPEGT